MYDLDITSKTEFEFIENYNNPWDYGIPDPEANYDLTIIEGKGGIQSLGEFKIIIIEYAAPGAQNYGAYNYFTISQGNINPLYISGSGSVNFKKLITQ